MQEWRLSKALNSEPIMSVTVERMGRGAEMMESHLFDADTLGRWPLIPEPYRIYGSMRMACAELSTSESPVSTSMDVCYRIQSYLEAKPIPDEVRRSLGRLWFDAALVAGDMAHLCQSLRTPMAGIWRENTANINQTLMELGKMAYQLEEQYPHHFRALLEPCVEQMVQHAGETIVEPVKKLIKSVNAYKWFSYVDLLLEVIRQQQSIKTETVTMLTGNYEAIRLSREKTSYDPSQSSATVKRYLIGMNDDPPPGTLTPDDVRHVLE